MRFKSLLMNLGCVALGTVLAFLALELLLRFLPVNEPFNSPESVTEENPILHFIPNGEFTFSRGFDFALVNTLRTNNLGFVNDQDYVVEGIRPLVAVVGDSYVEAAMVSSEETIQGRLARGVDGHGRIYSFGASGAPLSQYLAYSSYARDLFAPEAFIFVIVSNDFDESMVSYRCAPGFHHFFVDPNGHAELRLVEFRPTHPTLLHALASRLGLGRWALVRHLRTNLPMLEQTVIQLLKGQENAYVSQTLASVEAVRLEAARTAARLFLERIPEASGLPRERILFVVDGIRPNLYDQESMARARGSYWELIREEFMTAARILGHEVVDMQDRFTQDFAVRHQPFEFPTDGHWNGHGHAVAAEAVLESRMFNTLFPGLKGQ